MNINTDNPTASAIEQAQNKKPLNDMLPDVSPLPTVQNLILKKLGDMSIDKLGQEIGLSHSGIYKIAEGKSHPMRNVLLSIAFVLKMSIEETQQLLKSGHRSLLTGHDQRDVTIIYGLANNLTLDQMDELLIQNNFEPVTPNLAAKGRPK